MEEEQLYVSAGEELRDEGVVASPLKVGSSGILTLTHSDQLAVVADDAKSSVLCKVAITNTTTRDRKNYFSFIIIIIN